MSFNTIFNLETLRALIVCYYKLSILLYMVTNLKKCNFLSKFLLN